MTQVFKSIGNLFSGVTTMLDLSVGSATDGVKTMRLSSSKMFNEAIKELGGKEKVIEMLKENDEVSEIFVTKS